MRKQSRLEETCILETRSLILLFPSYCSIVVTIVFRRKSDMSFLQIGFLMRDFIVFEQQFLKDIKCSFQAASKKADEDSFPYLILARNTFMFGITLSTTN